MGQGLLQQPAEVGGAAWVSEEGQRGQRFGESHGQRSLAGYSPWGRNELDTTEVT